jgi:hypothetical protein
VAADPTRLLADGFEWDTARPDNAVVALAISIVTYLQGPSTSSGCSMSVLLYPLDANVYASKHSISV